MAFIHISSDGVPLLNRSFRLNVAWLTAANAEVTSIVRPPMSPCIKGLWAKVQQGLCTWEQSSHGFSEPYGSCMALATHYLASFEKPRYNSCLYHCKIWADTVYEIARLEE